MRSNWVEVVSEMFEVGEFEKVSLNLCTAVGLASEPESPGQATI